MDDKSIPSFEEISAKYGEMLFRYLIRITRNTADADNILQDIWLKVAQNVAHFRQDSSIKTWIFRIATNTAVDFFRKNKKGLIIEFIDATEPIGSDNKVNDNEIDALVVDEMNKCVRETIDSLPPDYRTALVLTSLEGFSISQTANFLNISVSATKVRIHRAKAHLHKKLNLKCYFYLSKNGNTRCDKRTIVKHLKIFHSKSLP